MCKTLLCYFCYQGQINKLNLLCLPKFTHFVDKNTTNWGEPQVSFSLNPKTLYVT